MDDKTTTASSGLYMVRDEQDIAWLHLDQTERNINVLGSAALGRLDELLSELEISPATGLVILSDRPGGFVAGADVAEFTTVHDEADALDAIRRGQAVFDRLEALPFPTLALIHGHCLGGGLELALACDYRIGAEDASLALPEVLLGIHPGFGGSMRLVRLIGALRAMDMMLSGRSVRAGAARKLGLLDHVQPPRQLLEAARRTLLDTPPRRRAAWNRRLLNLAPLRFLLAGLLRHQVAKKVSRRYYPAPYALIDMWRGHGGREQGMLRAEAASVARLVLTDTAKNLIRAFFLREELKGHAKQARDSLDARHVHVVGAGVMGGDIAAWCAYKGLRVTLQDTRREALAESLKRAERLFKRKLKRRHLVQAALDRLMPDEKGLGVARADVIIEAIIEDRQAKLTLLQSLQQTARPEALLASNTSSIPLQELSVGLEAPERLVGLHFFNPVARMPLLEIVAGEASDELQLRRAHAFAGQIDRLPVAVRSSPGFLVNRILTPYLLEAALLVAEGVPVRVIDQAARDFGMPMGPLELADTVGLDICLSVADRLDKPVPEGLHEMVRQGHLGKKSGRGFYRWQKGKKRALKRPGESGNGPADLQDRLVMVLLNEVVACLREGVVKDERSLDAGMIFGTGFAPHSGGPMHYIHERGATALVTRLKQLQASHGARFKADAGWEALS